MRTEDIVTALKAISQNAKPEDRWAFDEAASRLDDLERQIKLACAELAETHTHAQEVAASVGIDQETIDGDSYYVPTTEHLIDMIADRLKTPSVVRENLFWMKWHNWHAK